MSKSTIGQQRDSARTSGNSFMMEGLERRQLLSAAPVIYHPATPGKILAGNTGFDKVTVRNLTAAAVTEEITITLAPSLDGLTAAGAYTSPSVTETAVTIKKHGTTTIKVPFVPPTTLVAGKYHTLVTAVVGENTYNATAPGTYKLTLPPAPTLTPSLIGHYSGLITSNSGEGDLHFVHQASFILVMNAQDLTSWGGQINVGAGQANGTMTGSELNNGTFTYTFASANINYVITGKVNADGSILTGLFRGMLVDNIFTKLNGRFKLTRAAS